MIITGPQDIAYIAEMIRTYVPEADQMSFDNAFSLALERDKQAAAAMCYDETQLHMEEAVEVARV